jgi:hypothetical protein
MIMVEFVAGFLLGLNKHNNYHDEHILENKKLVQRLILNPTISNLMIKYMEKDKLWDADY